MFILKLDLAVETKKIKLSHKCQEGNGTNHLPDPPLDVLEVITPSDWWQLLSFYYKTIFGSCKVGPYYKL